MVLRISLTAILITVATVVSFARQEPRRITFRSSADLVSVAVVVRAVDGRLVTGLTANDFEVLDRGEAKPVVQFSHGREANARMALLVDTSGSMNIGGKRDRTRVATDLLVAGMQAEDTASVFSFDSGVRQLTPFTTDMHALRAAVAGVAPFGVTCLYDAIVGTIRAVERETPRARGLVLMTDGDDTASAHTADDAATAAAALDMPVYVLGVDDRHPGGVRESEERRRRRTLSLAELARRSGGMASEASTPDELKIATNQILSELQSQYTLAIAAGSDSGWHPLSVRVRKGRVQVRSREGYLVQ